MYGCTDPFGACNYNPDATADDGSCYYGTEYYIDNDGDGLGFGPGEVYCESPGDNFVTNNDDLNDNCASNIEDDCGVCDGDNSECGGCTDSEASNYNPDATYDDGSCSYAPELFAFNQSTLQAFYLAFEATIDGISLESNDWIGAFNGDVCVGARQWDTSVCGGGVCDLSLIHI